MKTVLFVPFFSCYLLTLRLLPPREKKGKVYHHPVKVKRKITRIRQIALLLILRPSFPSRDCRCKGQPLRGHPRSNPALVDVSRGRGQDDWPTTGLRH